MSDVVGALFLITVSIYAHGFITETYQTIKGKWRSHG